MSAPTRFAGTTGHPVGETKTGLAVGMDHGKVVTKLEQKQRPSYRKGKLNKRVAFVREVVSEVVGYSPYEKRCMELLKVRTAAHPSPLVLHLSFPARITSLPLLATRPRVYIYIDPVPFASFFSGRQGEALPEAAEA